MRQIADFLNYADYISNAGGFKNQANLQNKKKDQANLLHFG